MALKPTAPMAMILVNWNSQRFLPGLIESLRKQSIQPSEKLLIDNGSTDGSVEEINRLDPGWKTIRFQDNRGFSKAVNWGIRCSTAELVFLLNTDVVLSHNYLEILGRFLASNPHIGGAMGLLRRPDSQKIDSAGIIFSLLRRRPLDLYSEESRSDLNSSTPPFGISGINAAASLFRRSLFDSLEHGGEFFDESFGSYFEDADLSWRARTLGWSFACVPQAEAIHIRGGSGGLERIDIFLRSYANRFKVYLKNETFLEFCRFFPLNPGIELYRFVIKPLISPVLLRSMLQVIQSLPAIVEFRRSQVLCRNTRISPAAVDSSVEAYSSRLEQIGNRPAISIIIINYNTASLLRRCLESLEGNSINCRTFIVDNASIDGSQHIVRTLFPEITLIDLPENRGYAAAVNAGIAACQSDYYLILNSDTVLPDDFPQLLVEKLNRSPGVGIISPLIRNVDGTIQISWGSTPTLTREYSQRKLHRLYSEGDPRGVSQVRSSYRRDRSVDWVTGACMMIRHETIQQVGMMDEGFSLYFEDIDWCLRTKKAGWLILFTPELEIEHTGGASAANFPVEAAILYRKSQQYFYQKHFSRFQQLGLALFFRFRGKSLFNTEKFTGKPQKKGEGSQ